MTDLQALADGPVQEISPDDLDKVSGGFLFLIVLAAVALGGCLADCGHPDVKHP